MSENKKPISVTAMAKKLSLSRAHFYTLIRRNVFPKPTVIGKRPMYLPDGQDACLEVQRTGITISGTYIYFNEKAKLSASKNRKAENKFPDLIESLKALGLERVTSTQVEDAIKAIYPIRDPDLDSPETIKAIFLHLRQ